MIGVPCTVLYGNSLQRLEEYHGPPPAWSHSQTDPFWGQRTPLHLAVSPSRLLAPSVLKTGPFYSTHWHLNTLIRELAGRT